MAEGTITFFLHKLDAFIQDEVQMQSGVRDEVRLLRDLAQTMKNFLERVDGMDVIDPHDKTSMDRLREIVFDAEDVIDEFVRHQRPTGSLISCVSGCPGNFQSSRATYLDVQALRTRFMNFLTERRIEDFLLLSHNRQPAVGPDDGKNEFGDIDALLVEEDELVGIDNPKKTLLGWLLEEDVRLKVIAVHGPAGLGKTTLVGQVYKHVALRREFKYHAWIRVSNRMTKRHYKDMITQFHRAVMHTAPPPDLEKETKQTLKAYINKMLRQSSYLIVLDGVSNLEVFTAIKLLLSQRTRGRVMLTTQETPIARSATRGVGHAYRLKTLSEELSFELLRRKTFPGRKQMPQHLVSISQEILRRCEGLPLAINAIGGLLSSKDYYNRDRWQKVNDRLGAEIRVNNEIAAMRRVLSLSYSSLAYNLKSCFFYLSMFPEDYAIECSRLIRLWISEGFVQRIHNLSLEEVADDCLAELLARNLIQVEEKTTDGRIKTIRVHNMLHQISILKAKDLYFAAIRKSEHVLEHRYVRLLSIQDGELPDMKRTRWKASRLRSLFVFALETTLEASNPALLKCGLRMLKVLDMQAAPLYVFPNEILTLWHLTYLSLRRTKVKKIPKSIGHKLSNLEVFDLKHTFVEALPSSILEMKRLRHLLVYRYDEITSYADFHYKHGVSFPSRIGGLEALRKFCFEEMKAANEKLISDIGKLRNLTRLGITRLRRQDCASLCASIQRLSELRALSITSEEEEETMDLSSLSKPPRRLRRIYLTGRLAALPPWISSVPDLAKLFLKGSRLNGDPLPHLKDLELLVHVELFQVYEGRELCFKAGGFKKLKILGLDKCDALERVIFERGAAPKLEKLTIQRCQLFKSVPDGVSSLPNLKVLELFDMPEELTNSIQQGGNDYTEIEHIPLVYSNKWVGTAGRWDVNCPLPGTTAPNIEQITCWK